MKKNLGPILADKIAGFVGSWKFIIIQSTLLFFWVLFNVDHFFGFDPYPFILLNLFLSFQAAYATPMILMSGNRQAEKDRKRNELDLEVDEETNRIVKEILKKINETAK
jgi:uncharacterized membrane protein